MPSPRRRSGATLFLAPTPRLCNYGRGFMVFLDKRRAIGHGARVRQRSSAHATLRSGRRGMISLRMVGTEVSALGAAALSMPLRFVVERDRFDPSSPSPTPVVLVHGLFGDPTNFLLLRRYLAARGIRNFAAFSYPPRLDYQRLAPRLGDLIDTICLATGAPEVDLLGHSLGGLIARYLVEMPRPSRVRRLVTLGAPYFATPLPPEELAIFAAADPFIPPPHPIYGPHTAPRRSGGRVVVVPECGHWGLLIHPAVLREAAGFLAFPGATPQLADEPLALDAAS